MNQILNMIFRIFMRKMISRGIDAGIKSVGGGGQRRPKPARRAKPVPDTASATEEGGLTREQIRAKRRARRERRAARAAEPRDGS